MANPAALPEAQENNNRLGRLGRRVWTRMVPMLGLAVLMLVTLWAPKSEARLDPYYLLRGLSTGSVKPRILFAVDTSGSMTWKMWNQYQCYLSNTDKECEDPLSGNRSRVAAAREGIRTVVDNVGNVANFGLMTFGQRGPVDSVSKIPGSCGTTCVSETGPYYCKDDGFGFGCGSGTVYSCPTAWIYHNPWGPNNTHYDCGSHSGASCDGCSFGATCNEYAERRFVRETSMVDPTGGSEGMTYYRACGTRRRPFAYIRWDQLGYQSAISANNQTGAVPSSPLINTLATGSNIDLNEYRDVQWFPEFQGVRINLNASNDPLKETLRKTYGDYGDPDSAAARAKLDAEVWGQDFYYWPYVDGFIGYAFWNESGGSEIGHNSDSGSNNASLWSGFFLDGGGSLPPGADPGPESLDDARQMVRWLTSAQHEGGFDAPGSPGGTPWTSVIGRASTTALVSDNAPFSHSTVASYLKFVTSSLSSDACLPTAAILVTDGVPSCGSSCNSLYENIRQLRNVLNVDVYVVGFLTSGTTLQRMACAGAGAGSATDSNPCNDTPADNWDTCRNVTTGNQTDCAYVANNSQELADSLTAIVTSIVEVDLDAGPGSSANESGLGANGAAGQGVVKQTNLTASTEYPEWRGHVKRSLCERLVDPLDPLSGLAPECIDDTPFDDIEFDFELGGTTSCAQSRTWDAATCLQERSWGSRRIYFNDSANAVHEIWTGSGASTQFRAALNDPANGVPGAGSFSSTDARNIAAFIMGENWKDGYKLSGLANSAPTTVRRIPKWQSDFSPSVGIRDPHCAGRLLGFSREVDSELVNFAKNAWSTTSGQVASPSPHFEYQEAAVIGSDLGLVHFFQLNSGNELFAFLPRFHLPTVVEQFNHGGAAMGQPTDLTNHSFGVAATANNAWVYDDVAAKWRHIMVMGSGIGAEHFMAFDVSHLTPYSSQGPLEVLWTTQDSALSSVAGQLGETWARAAITFHNADGEDAVNNKVKGRVVLNSGYPSGTTGSQEGRYVAVLDATSGTVLDSFTIPTLTASTPAYDSTLGNVSDVAVASYCTSRYWGEAQEAYFNDPAGRLFRVDLEEDGVLGTPSHANDYTAAPAGANGLLSAAAVFPACRSVNATCTIGSSGDLGEAFAFSPAVAAIGRFDAQPGDAVKEDQLLIAMAGGSIYDESTDGGDPTNDFHSSLYIIRDDHRPPNERGGISVPSGAQPPGANAGFARVAISELTRQRRFTPYPGATEVVKPAGLFTKGTRPVSAPLIRVSQGYDGTDVIEDVEFYFIEFTVYEPPAESCNSDFRDLANGIWYADPGSTYKITFRLPVDPNQGFDFINGAGTNYAGGGYTGAGLEMHAVEQLLTGDCADGACGATAGVPSVAPCDPNDDPPSSDGRAARGMGYSEIRGFSPFE